jgi:hypothetical protein
MEAVRSSETWMDFCWTARRHVPEDTNLHGHRRKDLKPNTVTGLITKLGVQQRHNSRPLYRPQPLESRDSS